MANRHMKRSSSLTAAIVQSLSPVWLFATPWTAAHQASLSFPLPELAPTHGHRVSDAIWPSHPLATPSLFVFNPSQYQGIFQWASSSHQVAKVLEFQLQRESFQSWFGPWVGKIPGEGHGSRLQHSCLEKPVNRGAWQATIHRVAKSWTPLKWLSTAYCCILYDFTQDVDSQEV